MKIFVLLAVVICAVNSSPITGKADDVIQYKLEETTFPVHYNLEITPFLADDNEYTQPKFSFDATVEIELRVTQNTKTLRLHSKNLVITEKFIREKGSIATPTNTITDAYNIESEILTLTFANELVKDIKYILTFVYTGQMDKDMHGFYRSSYVQDGTEVWMGSTQMQQTHARRVFPGFDEPLYKATFQLTVNKPIDYSVYSNTNQEEESPRAIPGKNTYNQVTFKKTPNMSSYLLVFIVSKFERYAGAENDPKFGILARRDQNAQSEYAYTFGKRALELLGRYIGYDYYDMETEDGKLEKLDMAAIPDFSAGAMENWGLLTYRETNQLYDKDFTNDLTRQRIAAVIIHEQAHLWFGDLVTCAWWGDTWLNEGFARFFQYHATGLAEPLWEMDKQFVVEQLQTALLFDSSATTHPMSHEVNSPAEASAIFNSISYNKGASILRMIQHLIGNTQFVEAIRQYIKNNEYTATIPKNLFDEFAAITKDTTLRAIIEPWTTQANYPLITVTYDATAKEATVKQEVFLLTANADNKKTWSVPLTYTTRGKGFSNTSPSKILTGATDKIQTDATDSWLIFNVQQTGYYRVNYDVNNWKLIKAGLLSENHDTIHEINRAQIIDDLFNMARSGHVTFEFAFEMFDYLKTEENYLPWLSAFTTFSYLTSKMNAAEYDTFKAYVITLLEKSYSAVGWEESPEDSQLNIYHRSNVINWLCKFGHTECITKAKNLFDAYKADATKLVPINIRAPVYCSAIRHGALADLTFLWEKYLTQQVATEQLTILTAIGCASNKEVLEKVIENIMSDKVRDQDRRSALTNTYAQTEQNVQLVLDYVLANPEKIRDGFGGDLKEVVSTLTSLASRFTSTEQIEQLQKFYDDNTATYEAFASDFTRAKASATSQLEWNSAHIKEILDQIKVNHPDKVDDDDDAGVNLTASIIFVIALSVGTYLFNY